MTEGGEEIDSLFSGRARNDRGSEPADLCCSPGAIMKIEVAEVLRLAEQDDYLAEVAFTNALGGNIRVVS